jgi:hypothetical protein
MCLNQGLLEIMREIREAGRIPKGDKRRRGFCFRETHWTEGSNSLRHNWVVRYRTPQLGVCEEWYLNADTAHARFAQLLFQHRFTVDPSLRNPQ